MFTLALLVIIAAAAIISAGASILTAVPTPIEAALPAAAIGLTWRRLRDVETRNGVRTLWSGEGDPATFTRAYALVREDLRSAGFSWGTAERAGGQVQPVCWEDPHAPAGAMDTALAAAARALSSDDERRAQADAVARREDEAEAAAHGDARRADIAALRQCLETKGWAWSKRRAAVARAVLEEPEGRYGAPRHGAARLARELVAEVEAGLRDTRARVSGDPHLEWAGLAQDATARADVHRAVRLLTDLDRDQAALRNAAGWGQSHSRVGHVLAAMPELGVAEASHALAAVHRHRRQLPRDLKVALFGEG